MNTRFNNGWTKCPPGELAQLSSRLRVRTLIRHVGIGAAVLAGTALSVASAAKLPDVVSSLTAPPPYGKCHSHDCGCPGTPEEIP